MQRAAFFCLLLAISAGSAAYAQAPQAQGPQGPAADAPTSKPRDLTVAPDSPEKTPESKSGNPGHAVQTAGAPANVCAELVAFFHQKAAAPPDAAKPATDAAKDAKPGTQTAGPGQTAPPMDKAQQQSGISAPIPQDGKKAGGSQVTQEQAQGLAQANDLRGCQNAVQQMRRAGMALPPGLMALAALREDLLAKMAPAGQPPMGTQPAPAAK